jgi:nucleotide-binding universal stress UspA family protein
MADGEHTDGDTGTEGATVDHAEAGDREHVLVAYDGTPQSEAALTFACDRHADARITVLYAIDPVAAGYSAEVSLPSTAEEWYDSASARAKSLLSTAETTAADHGVTVETVTEVGRPAAAVVAFTREHGVDHVVIGSHGRTGVSRILLGSVAETVMRNSPVPVTVVR